jgi:hypothetical protein
VISTLKESVDLFPLPAPCPKSELIANILERQRKVHCILSYFIWFQSTKGQIAFIF